MANFLYSLAIYRDLFLLFSFIAILTSCALLLYELIRATKEAEEINRLGGSKLTITKDYIESTVRKQGAVARQNIIRKLLCPEGVDPNSPSYLKLTDGGKDVYVRSVTIISLPKVVKFGETFKDLFAFPSCTSSIFVNPIAVEDISKKIDKQINILETETIAAGGNVNRVRKLRSQVGDSEAMALEVESGDNSYYDVGFLFTLFANSLDELNKLTDDFRTAAKDKRMEISNCFAVQSEAFLAALPLNRLYSKKFLNYEYGDCVKMFFMDQNALSVVMNYTTDHYSHKNGIPLGRNIHNLGPVAVDLFDPSHDGYCCIICGKTGCGKTTAVKILVERSVPFGYRYVTIDSQTRKGTSEGEYTSLAEICGGVNYKISDKSSNILNIFDVQESTELIKEDVDEGVERRTLDLNGAISNIVCNLKTLIRSNDDKGSALSALQNSDMTDIITTITKELFKEREIEHGNPDSLYYISRLDENTKAPVLATKELPTLTDFFRKLISKRYDNREHRLNDVYDYMFNSLKEYVRELYYTESGLFFEREEFLALDRDKFEDSIRIYHGKMGDEPVMEIRGIRPYYDGQSTFRISSNYPVTNIDISQLPEADRRCARDIALHIIDEGFVRKNSEKSNVADKLVVIVDEAHESFKDPDARVLLENEVRTARKRNVAIIFSTQTVEEFFYEKETTAIFSQAAMKFIFKQETNDVNRFIENLNITESQAEMILNRLGVSSDREDKKDNSHRGEVCMIDGGQVQFIKIDYLKNTESLSVESNAASVMKIVKES